MSSSVILSRFSRLALLSVFCAGLFVTSGELSVNNGGGVEIGSGGVYSAMAEEKTQKDAKIPMDETINSIISFLNLGIGVLTFLITPLIMLAGWLLSPDWTFGEIFGLRPILHQLWILISNVVYVIFGFMLVFVAFANIFGWEHSKAYEMKTMLPKLVTGMLMVPFTWFIVSAVLSVSNVLTASVIQLPVATILKSGADQAGLLTDKIIPKEITFDKNASWDGTVDSNGDSLNTSTDTESMAYKKNWNFYTTDCDKEGNDCLSIKEFLTGGGGGAYNLLSVYAYGIFRIQWYKAITVEQWIHKVVDIASKLWFGIIFFLIFGILVIAIVYALFSRAIMLWLYAMFSPIFALNYVIGSKNKSLEKFTAKEFISLAMVPVYVSAALAFGLMFLGLVMGATGWDKAGNGSLKSDIVEVIPEGNNTTTFKFWNETNGITLKTIGLLDPETKNGASKALDIGKGVIGTIIMNVLALAILWMAVMAALGASKITEAAVAPIKWFGDEIGKLAMKAPQYIPIPMWKDKSITMAGVGSMGNSISGAISSAATRWWTEFGQKFGSSIAGAMWLQVDRAVGALRTLQDEAVNVIKTDKASQASYIHKNLAAWKLSAAEYGQNPIAREQLVTNFNKAWISKDNVTKLQSAKNETEVANAFVAIDQELTWLLFDNNKNNSLPEVIEFLNKYKSGTGTTATSGAIATPVRVTLPGSRTPSDLQVHITTPAEWTNHAKIDSGEFTRLLAELKNSNIGVDEATLKTELTKALKDKDIDIW